QSSESPGVPAEVPSDAAGEPVLLLTIEGAGRALGVGRSTIYQLVQQGDLEVVHIGRAARIPADVVHAYVRRLRRNCDHPPAGEVPRSRSARRGPATSDTSCGRGAPTAGRAAAPPG